MQTNLIIGWPNSDGSGKPVQFGPATSEKERQELGRMFNDAKKLHRFPKGVKFLATGTFDSSDIAIFISEATAENLQNEQKARKEREQFAASLDVAEKAVPAARIAIATAKKNLGRATENMDRAKRSLAAEQADDARYEALLKDASTKEDKERLKSIVETEKAQTELAKLALIKAQDELASAENAVAAAELGLPEAIKKLETLKAKT